MMLHPISGVMANDGTPEEVLDAILWRGNRLFEILDGPLSANEVYERIMEADTGGKAPERRGISVMRTRVFHVDNKTYVLSNQSARSRNATELMAKASRYWILKSSLSSKA